MVLEKLAAGLGVALASLFDAPADARAPHGPVARRDDQPQWRDPASGYVRRNVSPPGVPQPTQIVEVLFPFRSQERAFTIFDQSPRCGLSCTVFSRRWPRRTMERDTILP